MEVRADALRRNLATIGASVGPTVRLVPMVKADAYGTGVARAVAALEAADPWAFGVATVDEGIALRTMGVERPVVVFSPTPPLAVGPAVRARLTLTVSSVDAVERLRVEAAGREPAFHVEIDTGMGRAGFDWREAASWAPAIHAAAEAGLGWEGCYTHLHSADEGPDSVAMQWRRFQEALLVVRPPAGVLIHALNSAGALRCPQYAADAVRPGIFLYGGAAGRELPLPEPVVSVRARIVHVREASEGTTLGYGATHVAGREERWATLAIGYGDGLPRALGNRGFALVRGRRVPIVGRTSMDVTVVDISDVPGVEVGDVATLLGSDGEAHIGVDEVADLSGTVGYEVLTGFTPRIPRIWLDDHVGS